MRLRKRFAILPFLCGFTLMGWAQDDYNIVQNPSFEGVEGKLKKEKQIDKAEFWSSPTGLGADLFSEELKGDDIKIKVPDNYRGDEKAYDGGNYAGIVAYAYNSKEPRTYVTSQLLTELSKGQKYCVSYYVSLGDYSKYAVNNLSAYLSKNMKKIESEEKVDVVLEEKELDHLVFHPENKVFNQQYNWQKVCGLYTAEGGESWITIGNFKSNRDTKYEKMKLPDGMRGTQQAVAYYYIDMVSVELVTDEFDCTCDDGPVNETRMKYVYTKSFLSEEEFTTEELIDHSTIYYDWHSATIESSYKKDIERLYQVLSENPSLKINVIAHSDRAEEKEAMTNDALKNTAQKRADEIIRQLTEKGIDASRLIVDVKDDLDPATDGSSDLDKAKNRRVEFKQAE